MRVAGVFGAACVCVLAACDQPSDVLWTPPVIQPLEVEPGLYRVTFNAGPDFVRGFTPDGEGVVYASQGLPGASSGAWRMMVAPIEGGAVQEAAALYRRAIRQPVHGLAFNRAGRVLAFARANVDGELGCAPCLFPGGDLPAMSLVLYQLGPEDGAALSALPSLSVTPRARFPISGTTMAGGQVVPLIGDTVRVSTGQVTARRPGVNPFGPTAVYDSTVVYYSDGETIFSVDLASGGAPTPVTTGAFPAVSLDGRLLAVARPTALDSTVSECSVSQGGPGSTVCRLVTIEHVMAGWETVVYDRATMTPQFTVPGFAAGFHPDGDRMVVQRPGGLQWVQISTGVVTPIPEAASAYAPALSPRGDALAFTLDRFGNPDVFFLRLGDQTE